MCLPPFTNLVFKSMLGRIKAAVELQLTLVEKLQKELDSTSGKTDSEDIYNLASALESASSTLEQLLSIQDNFASEED